MNQLRRRLILPPKLTRQTPRSMPKRKLRLHRPLQQWRRNRTLISMTGRMPLMISLKLLPVRLNVRICPLLRQKAKNSLLMRRRRRRRNQVSSRKPVVLVERAKRSSKMLTLVKPQLRLTTCRLVVLRPLHDVPARSSFLRRGR